MKLLYIAPYLESSGWGIAARHTLACMHQAGIDVVPRPTKFDSYKHEKEPWLKELEAKSYEKYDAVLYYLPPDNIVYNKRLGKNIAFFLCETDDIIATHWLSRLELMDEVWVPTYFIKTALIKSGYSKPIRLVPIPCDTSVYYKSWPVYPQIKAERQGDFLFYTVADFNKRKNTEALVRAFHTEFHYNEPVNLVLKLSKNQVCYEGYKLDVRDWVNNLKFALKLGRTKDDIIIPNEYLTDAEIYGIHKGCDVFISPSRGEGWNIPLIDAIGFGKTPIGTNYSSHPEIINESNGWLVEYRLQNCFGMNDFNGSLYSAQQSWGEIDVIHLRQCMREAFEDNYLREDKSDGCADTIERFSYESVGSIIKKALNNEPASKGSQSA